VRSFRRAFPQQNFLLRRFRQFGNQDNAFGGQHLNQIVQYPHQISIGLPQRIRRGPSIFKEGRELRTFGI